MRSTAGANGLAQGKRLTKQRVASKLQPVLAGVTVESKPLRHSAPANGLEPYAHAGRFELVDALAFGSLTTKWPAEETMAKILSLIFSADRPNVLLGHP